MSRAAGAARPPAEVPLLTTRIVGACPACGHDGSIALPLVYDFAGARFPLRECRGCGLRYLGVQPDAAGLARLYGEDYFEQDYRCGRAAGSSFDERAFVDENRGLLDAFARLGPPGRLLDVGCAAGWLLAHAGERGWSAHGVEWSEAAAGFARARGLDVVQGELAAARWPDAWFDLVYLGDVLEHVPDCRATLREVARVLKPGGFLYLRGPITTNSLARRLGLLVWRAIGRPIVLREPPYHLWEFTPGPLDRLLVSCGLEVVEARQSKIPPGRSHGTKGPATRLALAALDAINLPITKWTNRLGDRIVIVARRLPPAGEAGPGR